MVTGGSRGIGAEIVRRFALEGARVYFTYLTSEAEAQALVRSLKSAGRIQALKCDVRNKEEVECVVNAVLEKESRIDVLVNNAGVIRDGLFSALEDADWRDVLETNLGGTYFFCRQVLPAMIAAGGGRIVNISSVVGELGGFGQANYAASKGAVNALTKALAAECAAKNITVNAVAPGMVKTGMSEAARSAFGNRIVERIPLGGFAEPWEIAAAVAFLASEEARYITGQIINIDGGLGLLSRK